MNRHRTISATCSAEVRHYRNGEQIARRHWIHNDWELLAQQRQVNRGQWVKFLRMLTA
ncbi:hypothetical protein H2Y54_08230 [Pectobacterium aroidearum]|nr:hypothetical protein [Pectobacterium aroidearum]MBA5236534.1 hypothetical protein [Pectobacterium aroidearum]